MILWLDFETRSRCDLEVSGSYNYAAHASTEIVIASWAVDAGPIRRWSRFGRSVPVIELQNLLRDPRVEVRAHNAAFERRVMHHCWKITVPPERFYCTMFQARSASLPGALADVGRALTADMRKNPRGYQLIRLLSIPDKITGKFNEDIKLYEEFGDYCDQDVNVMRMYSRMLPPLEDMARRVYTANEVINDRGLPIDLELCRLAVGYAEEEKAEAEADVQRITNGALLKARGQKLTDWLYDELPECAQALMRVKRRTAIADMGGGMVADTRASKRHLLSGEEKEKRTLDAATRSAIFALAEERPEEFSEDALAVLAANDAVQSSSVHKFQSMLDTTSADGRLRGAFVPAGAAGTGRFSSHNAQLHNFPRTCHPDPEAVKQLMREGKPLGGPVLMILKSLLRAAIWPGKGRVIVRADWNAIEARALPWLSDRASAGPILEAFADPNRDPYIEQSQRCGLGEKPNARDIGKVMTLAFGYGGAEKALDAMAKNAHIVIEGDKKALVAAWRHANPWAPEFWNATERKAKLALAQLNEWFPEGRIALRAVAWGEKNTLTMLLPSKRLLYYPYAGPPLDANGEPLEDDGAYKAPMEYLKASWKPKANAPRWPRGRAWGGLMVENATQATCADLLREALVAAVERGLPVIGHVHDEIVCEASVKDAPSVGLLLHDIMLDAPAWAKGLPLAVETDIGPRYRK